MATRDSNGRREIAAANAKFLMLTADVVVSVLQYGQLDDESRDQLQLVAQQVKFMAAEHQRFVEATR